MILPLSDANRPDTGGKARGLAGLMEIGLSVPDGIVLLPGEDENRKAELKEYLNSRDFGEMAVRSSAMAEDGEQASFAGQFESFLHCSTMEMILEAVEKCLGSAGAHRVGTYRQRFEIEKGEHFPVVIQDMVKAEKSGVIFTCDPVNQRTDRWTISVTRGVGEDLMAGTTSGEEYLLNRNGRILRGGDLLSKEEIRMLVEDAWKAQRHFGKALDLEWAIDGTGQLYWLQVRPVTTLPMAHLNELDGDLLVDNEVFTRANVGEMMPGPVTPLTGSVFGRAIEVGLRDFYHTCGVPEDYKDEWVYFRIFYNHIFFSMTRLVDISGAVLLNRKENVEFAIMGKTLGEEFGDYRPLHPLPWPRRLINQIRQFRYLASGVRRMKALEKIAGEFQLIETKDPGERYRNLDESLAVLFQAYSQHYCASSQSGSYQSAIMGILSGGRSVPENDHYRDAAILMSDLQNVESADVVQTIDRIYREFRDDPGVVRWIRTGDRKNINGSEMAFGRLLESMLEKHGHRCVREAELREKSWQEDREPLIKLIRRRFEAGERVLTQKRSYEESREEVFEGLKWMQRRILSLFLKPARKAVARREYTKSLAVKVQQKFKAAYLKLAQEMVEMSLLEDVDQVFFLTHRELGICLTDRDQGWKKLAGARREAFPASFDLVFPDVCMGFPEPLEEEKKTEKINGDTILGLPVSTGKVKAKIRIIEKLEDACELEKGEIMACRFTDVGWTPYFSLAAGLITEIGSPLSHGAVVAREYGIPAVVNAKGALDFFKTGEQVILDGGSGQIRKLNGIG